MARQKTGRFQVLEYVYYPNGRRAERVIFTGTERAAWTRRDKEIRQTAKHMPKYPTSFVVQAEREETPE